MLAAVTFLLAWSSISPLLCANAAVPPHSASAAKIAIGQRESTVQKRRNMKVPFRK
jgi:hypothetical protein